MHMYRLILVTLLCGTCLPALAGEAINVTRSISAKDEVHISTLAGRITVHGWNKSKIHVSGQLAEQAKRLDVHTGASGIEIKVVYPHLSHGNFNQNEGSHLTVEVPHASPIKIDTVSTDVDIRDVRGKQRLKSTSGNITLASKSKDISMHSVSGDINLRGSAAKAHLEVGSISGDVALSNLDGALAANSISGGIYIKKCRLSRASIKSTSGGVDFTGSIARGGEYDFHTVSGRVRLNFPAPPNARFDISTFSGEIDNNFGPKPKKANQYTPARKLAFVSGKSAALVNIDSLSGRIELHAGR